MISSPAAHRVLLTALAHRDMGPDSVDAASMAELLTGPVYATLGEVLPKEGLHRQLQALAASLPGGAKPTARERSRGARAFERDRARSESARDLQSARAERWKLEADGADATRADGNYAAAGHGTEDDDAARDRAGRYLEHDLKNDPKHDPQDDQEGYDEEAFWRIGREEARAEHAIREEAAGGLAGDTAPRSAEDARGDKAAWHEGSSAAPAAPWALARQFAALEHVTSVAAFAVDTDGEPAQEAFQGEGFERDALRALAIGGRALLSEHGAFRSYRLRHDRGQVLVFAHADLTLVLLARPEFDPTAAFGTWAALLEAR